MALSLKTPTPSAVLEYRVKHRPRVTRRLHLELGDQGELVVVAPRHWSTARIDVMLSQNQQRVERFLATARLRQVEPPDWIDGGMHFYLGGRYPLAIEVVPGSIPRVKFDGARILVRVKRGAGAGVRTAMLAWYRQQASKLFDERLRLIAHGAPWTRGRRLVVQPRRMKRTWGNCSASGLIKLNTHLIKAPLPIIDSVIAHELCHLVEMNHGKAFYTLLENLNPGWRRDRAVLCSRGHLYLA